MHRSKFARNLKFLRRLNGWTQEGLAVRIGIKRNKISSYESGFAEPSFATLNLISGIFKIRLDDIINKSFEEDESNIKIKPHTSGPLLDKALKIDISKYIYNTNSAQKFLDGLLAFQSLNKKNEKPILVEKYVLTLQHMLQNNWKLIEKMKNG